MREFITDFFLFHFDLKVLLFALTCSVAVFTYFFILFKSIALFEGRVSEKTIKNLKEIPVISGLIVVWSLFILVIKP